MCSELHFSAHHHGDCVIVGQLVDCVLINAPDLFLQSGRNTTYTNSDILDARVRISVAFNQRCLMSYYSTHKTDAKVKNLLREP